MAVRMAWADGVGGWRGRMAWADGVGGGFGEGEVFGNAYG